MKNKSVWIIVAVCVIACILAAFSAIYIQNQKLVEKQQRQLEQYTQLVLTFVNSQGSQNEQTQQLQFLLEHAPLPIESIALVDEAQKVYRSVGNHSQIAAELTTDMNLDAEHWRIVVPTQDASAQFLVMQGQWLTQASLLPFIPLLLCTTLLLVILFVLLQQLKSWRAAADNLLDQTMQLPKKLQPFRDHFMALQDNYKMLQQKNEAERLQHQQNLQFIEQRLEQLLQERATLSTQSERQQHMFNCWQQLASKAQQMSEAELQHKVAVLKCFGELSTARYSMNAIITSAPQWLLQGHSQWQKLMPEGVSILYDESPQAYQYELQFDAHIFTLLLTMLLRQSAMTLRTGELELSYRINESPQRNLQIQIRYEGDNLPEVWRNTEIVNLNVNYSELEPLLFMKLVQQLGLVYRVESLAGIGTHIQLTMPISLQKKNHAKAKHCIALLANEPRDGQIYRQSLLALSEQVIHKESFADLQNELKTRIADLIVLNLPNHFDLTPEIVKIFNDLNDRTQLLCFATPQVAGLINSQINVPTLNKPIMLEQLVRFTSQEQELRSQQILVVDDNPTNLSFVQTILSGQGIGIDIATTGAEAIEMARHSRYQLILMDIQLPDIHGTEVTQQIRQFKHHRKTVVLAFTAHAMQEEIVSFKLAGMDDVLIKPLDAKKIAHILTRLKPLAVH